MSEEQPPYRIASVLYETLEVTSEQILQAYYDCFTTGPGLTVLRHLYEGICSGEMSDLTHVGRMQVYQQIIENIRMHTRIREDRIGRL